MGCQIFQLNNNLLQLYHNVPHGQSGGPKCLWRLQAMYRSFITTKNQAI